MTIPMLLTICGQLDTKLTDEELDYEIQNSDVVWDCDRELVKKIYKILEEYRKEYF